VFGCGYPVLHTVGYTHPPEFSLLGSYTGFASVAVPTVASVTRLINAAAATLSEAGKSQDENVPADSIPHMRSSTRMINGPDASNVATRSGGDDNTQANGAGSTPVFVTECDVNDRTNPTASQAMVSVMQCWSLL